MAELQDELFIKLRSVIGGYLVDLIVEEGAEGVARLVREGMAAKTDLDPEEDARITQILRRLEGGR